MYYAEIVLGENCDLDIYYGWQGGPECVTWVGEPSNIISECGDDCSGPG
ncbi:unnamed protein product [marine sediment metagenome]|uniref:Uncharacterized protein n=1 Tax=marine sediment metagenome TaxID=412755 RepID=X1N3W2_9ZZZZ